MQMFKLPTKLLAVSLMIFFAVSCDQKENVHAPVAEKENEHTSHDHSKAEENSIQLNDGNRWVANAETSQGVRNMQAIVEQFEKDGKSADLAAIHEQLTLEFTTIFEKCTMTGEAHEQLHTYLIPIKELLDGISPDNAEKSKENIALLKAHLSHYTEYFQ